VTSSLLLLLAVTGLYAGYNLFVKVSSSYVPVAATSTVLATICLQLAALAASISFLSFLALRGGHVLSLPTRAYGWAVAAGLCIGVAEICYFYLFRGSDGREAVAASVAIPVIVSGTIAITLVVSHFVLQESLTSVQLIGTALVVLGVVMISFGAPG